MAESEASVEPTCSPEWVKSTMESIKNAEKIRETDPEAYREWFQNFMSEQEAAAPKAVPEEMQWAKMEANMKAFVDHDPQLMKNLDMEAVKASWDFAHKVKLRLESSPETYQEFMKAYQDEAPTAPQPAGEGGWERIHEKLKVILKDEPDLLKDFEALPVPSKQPAVYDG